MCDPLSVTASILAVIGSATQSCEYLSQVFCSFSEAPEDLRHHIAALESLKATFKDISTLETALPHDVEISSIFRDRLRECLLDLQSMEDFMRPLSLQLTESRVRRTWTRVRWSSPIQRNRIRKLLARIDSYHTTFSLDLLLLDIRLGLRPRNNVISCSERQSHSADSQIRQKNIEGLLDVSTEEFPGTGNVKSSASNRSLYPIQQPKAEDRAETYKIFAGVSDGSYESQVAGTCPTPTKLLAAHRPDLCINKSLDPLNCNRHPLGQRKTYMAQSLPRSKFLKHSEHWSSRAILWLGPVLEQRLNNDICSCHEPLACTVGYGVGFAITAYRCFPFRFELAGFFQRAWGGPTLGFSIHWSCSLPRILPWENEIIRLALAGDVDAVETSLRNKILTPFDVLPNGSTLLHLAASQDQFSLVEYLLREGAKVNAVNDFGETPLHLAASISKDHRICQILLDNDADISNRDAGGRTPLHTFFSPVVERMLRYHGSYLDFATQDNSGRNLLHYMAWSSKTTSGFFRLFHDTSNIDLKMADVEGKSILHFAAQRGNRAIIEYVCNSANAIDFNSKDVFGNTVLHYAVESTRASNIIPILVACGVDVRVKNNYGRSALHLASKLGRLPAVQALLAHGSTGELNVRDTYGMTPVQIAANQKAESVLALLTAAQQPCDRIPQITDEEVVISAIETDSVTDSAGLADRIGGHATPSRFQGDASRSTITASTDWTRRLSKLSFRKLPDHWCFLGILFFMLAVWAILSFITKLIPQGG